MLATITSYWFVSLPGIVTGLLLLKLFKQVRESKQAKERVPVSNRKR